MADLKPYAVYWSIYTDWRGRRDFRKLYWDRLKDAMGRPAKLVGIEREELWPSGLPSGELRCHVWRFFRAGSDAETIAETLRAAMRVAPEWRVLDASARLDANDLIELLWDRYPKHEGATSGLAFPKLTSILVTVRRDTGFRVRPGYTIRGGGEKERPDVPALPPRTVTGTLSADWRLRVQTSTKRELMETHWPLLERRFGGEAAEMVDLEKRGGDVGPFRFTVHQKTAGIAEPQAVSLILQQCTGMWLSMQTSGDGAVIFNGRSDGPDSTDAHRLIRFEAVWKPGVS